MSASCFSFWETSSPGPYRSFTPGSRWGPGPLRYNSPKRKFLAPQLHLRDAALRPSGQHPVLTRPLQASWSAYYINSFIKKLFNRFIATLLHGTLSIASCLKQNCRNVFYLVLSVFSLIFPFSGRVACKINLNFNSPKTKNSFQICR